MRLIKCTGLPHGKGYHYFSSEKSENNISAFSRVYFSYYEMFYFPHDDVEDRYF